MNKRVEELIIESCDQMRKITGKPWGINPSHYPLFEKFAELIVRECMEQVWHTREDSINGNISQVIKDRINEHFGVE